MHVVEDELGIVSLSNLLCAQEEICIVCDLQQIPQVLHEVASCQPSPHHLLYFQGSIRSLFKVEMEVIS